MADYPIPKNGVAYIFYASLVSQADTKLMKSAPTLAAGDFKVSIDGGALANLATLPTNTPSGVMVKFSLSSGEMTGDNITVVCIDAAGAEWCDVTFNIQTSARGIADLAYPATTGRSMVVDASGLVDANMVKTGPTGTGTAQTARDLGASVLLSSGTGTGQLDFTSGIVKSNLSQILGTALTETAGLIAAGFKKFFNVATPTGTVNSLPDAAPAAVGGLLTGPTTANTGLADVTQLGGVVQSLTDLKDFADDGYDPSTNKVQGVVLTDTLTTYTGNTVQTGDSYPKVDTEVATLVSGVADIQARLPAALTAGGNIKADALAFSGDTVAADNAESFFDGTGYAGTNNVIPLVTLVTTLTTYTGNTLQTADVAARTLLPISGSVNDASAGVSSFITDLSSAVTDFYADLQIVFTSGALTGQARIIIGYVQATKTITLDEVLTSAPANGVTFRIFPMHVHTRTQIASRVWDTATSGHTTAGTFGEQVKTDIDDILTDTAVIGAAGAGLTAVPWNAAWDAEVQSEVDDALVVHRLDELLNADSDIDGISPPTVGSVFHELMTKTTGSFTFDQTTDSLEALRDRGDVAWITSTFSITASAIASQVRTELTTELGRIDVAVSSRMATFTYTAPDNSSIMAILADTNELQTDWANGGRLDLILDAAGSAGDPWVTALPGAYGAGTAGKIVGDNLNATVSSRASQTSVDTVDDLLDTEIAAILAAVDTEVATIVAATAASAIRTALGLAAANLDTQIGTLATSSALAAVQADLPIKIVANTAYDGFPFVMVDSSDVPLTGLTVTAQRSLDGGAFAACTNAPAEVASGAYKIDLAATDTNASNFVLIKFTATGAKTRFVLIVVQRT